ncbi:type I-F CRISPR-associated helicase Cas3f [Acinetobacter sp.]|uniref:type I-F CRISPR-associated helicase Cas3f n=1 Tax=Acinetobacter sp. TaxID=472 RepID=UPI0035B25C6E
MIVTLISQCEKKALARTRRVLGAFADRIGDNTWQTVITEDGLLALKKLLRQSATKNTAVSCHWIRGRRLSELLWVVGNRSKFNSEGVVPVNSTKRKILQNEWENNWQYASSIQIIATLAALLHDQGKSTIGFQNKLTSSSFIGDPYRHEWISLKLFELLIADCPNDKAWLNRLINIEQWLSENDISQRFKQCNPDKTNIATLPPLAQWVAWLIVTHHRLPPIHETFYKPSEIIRLKNERFAINNTLNGFYKQLRPVDFWVKNPRTIEDKTQAKTCQNFWQFKQLVVFSKVWQKHIKRWSNKALADINLIKLSQEATEQQKSIQDTFLLYLSRLSLMIGDHNYSSLADTDSRRVEGAEDFKTLSANTDKITREIKQPLDEHLIGVATFTAKFARHLPSIASQMPTLEKHRPLEKNTSIERFAWQNHAYKLAKSLQQATQTDGFFGVNMASTGCGKTIGNARIMYGLADPKVGARFTIALGLRVLTLQTGQSFRQDLNLNDEQLAILVGGTANKNLFEYNQKDKQNISIKNEAESSQNISPVFGSESSEELIEEWLDSSIDYQDYSELNIDTILTDTKARCLLFSPIVTCTVDHIIQASECKRGGKFIAPMLRLLSSDLILDEPDDFDQNDLPALARLVHLAGVFGSRVLLSSATLTPDLIAGLYQAYLAGRKLFNQSQNKASPNVVCAWFDEQEKAMMSVQCAEISTFNEAHEKFIAKRIQFLKVQPVRRQAEIFAITAKYHHEKQAQFYAELGQSIIQGAMQLHEHHHQVDEVSTKRVSIGLLRIANISQLTQIALQLFAQSNIPTDTHIHLACYHSKQLLVLRNDLENRLDRILKRSSSQPNQLFLHSEIQNALAKSNVKNHLFIVLATPVAEVGRDHDYDWAIVEPSSMRSIIQLAGRVWRHRPEKIATHTNILLMQYNIRHLRNQGKSQKMPVFVRPGFETLKLKPHSYDLCDLVSEAQLQKVDAQPRISKDKNFKSNTQTTIQSLAELEHRVMANVMNNAQTNYVNAYWQDHSASHRANTHLQQLSPFRDHAGFSQEDWLVIPNEESPIGFDAYYAEDVYANTLKDSTPQNQSFKNLDFDFEHPQISPWLNTTLEQALLNIQQHEPEYSINSLAIRYASVSLDRIDTQNSRGWLFSEYLGFIRQ